MQTNWCVESHRLLDQLNKLLMATALKVLLSCEFVDIVKSIQIVFVKCDVIYFYIR